MRRRAVGLYLLALGAATAVALGASLEKAKTLRQNGLLDDAKKELVELVFDADSSSDVKAEALLTLGDIAIDEKEYSAAKENWNKAITGYPSTSAATLAKEKLRLLEQLRQSQGEQEQVRASHSPKTFPPGTVLVVAPKKYDWALLQISGALGGGAVPFEGSLLDAHKMAGEQKNVIGIVELTLDTESLYESGHVTCYRAGGARVWQEKTMFNMGGGEEKIARRFVDKLSGRVKGRKCP